MDFGTIKVNETSLGHGDGVCCTGATRKHPRAAVSSELGELANIGTVELITPSGRTRTSQKYGSPSVPRRKLKKYINSLLSASRSAAADRRKILFFSRKQCRTAARKSRQRKVLHFYGFFLSDRLFFLTIFLDLLLQQPALGDSCWRY